MYRKLVHRSSLRPLGAYLASCSVTQSLQSEKPLVAHQIDEFPRNVKSFIKKYKIHITKCFVFGNVLFLQLLHRECGITGATPTIETKPHVIDYSNISETFFRCLSIIFRTYDLSLSILIIYSHLFSFSFPLK